jgi:tRNA(Ile)-lysidine synthetase-like protein
VVRGHRLFLEPHAIQTPRFTYSVRVPGRWTLKELGTDLLLRWGEPDEPWIYRGHPKRAALGVPEEALETLGVRNLQPGDRMQPIGVPFRKKVSDLLRDRRVPLAERPSWPVLVVENRVAWVPGVAIEEAFRVREGVPTLVAELEGFPPPSFLEKELS